MTAALLKKPFIAAIRYASVMPALWVVTANGADAAVVNSPSQTAVNLAINAPLISYNRSFNGGAYTNGAWFGGASVVLATASNAGNTTADGRLLQQIRHSIIGTNAICANGGYPAQHERHATGMFAIAKHTPRVWNQLTTSEKNKIDLLVKAAFVASAFVTADNNPYVLAGTAQRTLNDDYNMNRDWNPNYREGMIGGVLVGMVYFGGPAAANAILNQYHHASFVAELAAAGLTNTHETFNWKAANPSSTAPSGTQIAGAVANYRYKSIGMANYMGIYTRLAEDTFGKNVNAGLNNGAGIGGNGRIASGSAGLPSPGAAGMLKEFDSLDGGGARSSMEYAYDSYRPHQTNQLVLVIGGYWPKKSPAAAATLARIRIGIDDLWYKMAMGYYNYSSGQGRGYQDFSYMINNRGFGYVRSLWEDVLRPYHDSTAEVDTDTDGDNTGDSVEIRLGLDPFNSASRFTAQMAVPGRLEWRGHTGTTFDIQRASDGFARDWRTIATVPGSMGQQTYVDPAPPPGRALYRVALRP
jgi:hypothetical protein